MLDHHSSKGRLREAGQTTNKREHLNIIKAKVEVGGRSREQIEVFTNPNS